MILFDGGMSVGNIQLTLITLREKRIVDINLKSLLLAGYAGRDREAVEEHKEELRKIGISPPEKVPTVYKVSPELLTTEREIAVRSETTSGEIEYVLLPTKNGLYVTVGSDHTDREIEKTDIQKAKESCPKVIAKVTWLYDEIGDHWDDIIMRAMVLKDGLKTVYQEGNLEELLSAENLLGAFDARREGTALFSGTIPLKQELIYTNEFEMEIYDSKAHRKISHTYRIRRMV
jgi:hypothetical protein